jgi:hypothetical protein
MSATIALKAEWRWRLVPGVVLISVAVLTGCSQGGSEVASLKATGSLASSGSGPVSQDLGQYERALALEGCLVNADLPALLTPMDGGEAQIGWTEGHEILARDFEQWTEMLEGPDGEIDPAVHDAFMDVEADSVTLAPVPALWVDGKDHSDTWIECLKSSEYTNPTAYMEQDPGDALLWAQRMAASTNDWIACAREHGFPRLRDVTADADNGPLGPHVEIPLNAELSLLQTVVDACPLFSEEIAKRVADGDTTLDDDILEGRVTPNPLVYVEQPVGAAEDDYDFGSGEGKRYLDLTDVLFSDGRALEERYVKEAQNGSNGDAVSNE